METENDTQPAVTFAELPESVQLAKVEQRNLAHSSVFETPSGLAHWKSVALIFSNSKFVPEAYRNNPDDCLIALEMAVRMNESPLALMQSTYFVKGRPGFYTAYMIARANQQGGLRSKIRWEVERLGDNLKGFDNLRVTAWATDGDGERIDASVDTKMALAEKWTTNPKYSSMMEHMLRWRSAAFLIRLHCPEVMLGTRTVEELETMEAEIVEEGPSDGGPVRITKDDLKPAATESGELEEPEEDKPEEDKAEPEAVGVLSNMVLVTRIELWLESKHGIKKVTGSAITGELTRVLKAAGLIGREPWHEVADVRWEDVERALKGGTFKP